MLITVCSGLDERDEYNGTMHYNDLDTGEILGVESFPSNEDESVEDAAIKRILVRELHKALNSLSDAGRELINALNVVRGFYATLLLFEN